MIAMLRMLVTARMSANRPIITSGGMDHNCNVYEAQGSSSRNQRSPAHSRGDDLNAGYLHMTPVRA